MTNEIWANKKFKAYENCPIFLVVKKVAISNNKREFFYNMTDLFGNSLL